MAPINLLNVGALANFLSLTIHSVRFHIRKGRIRPSIKLGRRMLFDPKEVIDQLKQQKTEADSKENLRKFFRKGQN